MTGRPGLHPGHPTAEGGLPASKPGLSLALMTWFECTKQALPAAKSVTGCDFPGCRPGGVAGLGSGLLRGTEAGFEVGQDVVKVLNSHRKPDQPRSHAGHFLLLR